MTEMARMTKAELQRVPDFLVRSKYAEVRFLDPVDLVGVDIDRAISMEPSSVDISKEVFNCQKGRVLIKYFNFGGLKNARDQQKRDKIIAKLHKWVNKMGVHLVRFDEQEGEVTISI